MSTATNYDAIIIGWGKGGKTLAAFLAGRGESVLMIEQSEGMVGGTCINIGCVPTKALVESAHRSADSSAPAPVRYLDAIERKNALTSLLRGKNFSMVDSHDTATVLMGRARFVGPHEIEVSAGAEIVRVTSERIIINTGAVPMIPPIPGLDGPRVVSSTKLIDETDLPGRLVVIGAGAIGLELAATYREFGSEVTVVDSVDRLLPQEDDDVAAAVREVLEEEGLTFMLGATVERVEESADAALVRLEGGDTLTADRVLVAVGRRPATDDLGLEAAGIALGDNGAVRVDEHLRTSVDGVWAVGDVNGGPQFTYVSFDDHRIVKDQLVGDGARTTSDRVAVPTTTFITPPLARVGMTEREAREAGRDVKVARKAIDAIAAMPRARIVGDTRGLIKVVVDASSDLVLGAALFCVDSQEIVNLVALAMRAGVTASELRDGIWTHPSSTEALNEVLATL
ncbi:pyridine nucleotide-disulfide oxidoreductase [Knoellia sinensis KCTC 19936]|uniref:Pyridine nucleotide-disulfide oxidoreductase n=1 Tax=Knoellia sinensis KCTC 19936 TaxID=1385520 RepID=A0A0A0JF98_9MICO|nr:FAD-dependent oxidoreductase [Knoellia sinensis]KGN34286.1 pyridine nucleotide-disulfide oxidoreductase [Knoellia sinensis KCTC 19936]